MDYSGFDSPTLEETFTEIEEERERLRIENIGWRVIVKRLTKEVAGLRAQLAALQPDQPEPSPPVEEPAPPVRDNATASEVGSDARSDTVWERTEP